MADTFSGGKNVGSPQPAADTTPTPPTDPVSYADVVEAEALAKELAMRPFMNIFGEISEHDQSKLDFIIDSVKGDDKKMPTEEVVSRIKAIEKKLGLSWHEPILERVYRHVKLVRAVNDSMLGGL